MKRRTAIIASISGVLALALVAILVIPGFTAESQGNAPQNKLTADGDPPARHLADLPDGQLLPGNCGMTDMPDNWDMEDMPEQCQQMMANYCMGAGGMMSMHESMGSMMGMHHQMMGNDTTSGHRAAMENCPMQAVPEADANPEESAQ
ncbi:MAG TPA: hypothetical protein ENO21_04960 [Firmicutes bacterium]|nr:hypothetical protein [Bacillota bacterium]